MNVAILSDFETLGGAAIATSRLAEGLREAGLEVTRIVAFEDGKPHSWKTIPFQGNKSIIDRMARRVPAKNFAAKYNERKCLDHLENLLQSIRPQVINLHNIHSALSEGWSVDFLRVCQNFAPTLWTLHDMWSFTGRCAYSYDCRKFIDGCDSSCPTPHEYPALAPDRIKPEWQKRQEILGTNRNILCVTPSQWMAKQARAGLWSKARVKVIPNGLPVNVFTPIERAEARMELGITTNGIVMTAVAQDFEERRKGGNYLQEGLSQIVDEDLTLIIMGQGKINIPSSRVTVHSLGFVNEDRIKMLAYNAADFLIHTAPVDNFPNVLVEAFACGTPAVAFDVCGIPELVRPGVTGWLANEVTASSFADTVRKAIQDVRHGINFRQSCRTVTETEYELSLQARRYSDLFSQLTS